MFLSSVKVRMGNQTKANSWCMQIDRHQLNVHISTKRCLQRSSGFSTEEGEKKRFPSAAECSSERLLWGGNSFLKPCSQLSSRWRNHFRLRSSNWVSYCWPLVPKVVLPIYSLGELCMVNNWGRGRWEIAYKQFVWSTYRVIYLLLWHFPVSLSYS